MEPILTRPRLPDGSQGRVFKDGVCVEGCRGHGFLWLVGGEATGWCFQNRSHQSSGSMFVPAMYSLSST